MIRSRDLLELVTGRRTRHRIGAVAAAALAVGASPASAQYGADPPLPPLPPLQTVAPPPAPAPATPSTPSPPAPPPSDVVAAVGGGDSAPAAGTAGEVEDTGVGSRTVDVVSSERAAPVALGESSLPFTGAELALLAAIGAGLLALGFGLRRRTGARMAKP